MIGGGFESALRASGKKQAARLSPGFAYSFQVKKSVQKFASFKEADDAEIARYRAMTPDQRMDLLLDLVAQGQPRNEAERRLKRVYRIVELSES